VILDGAPPKLRIASACEIASLRLRSNLSKGGAFGCGTEHIAVTRFKDVTGCLKSTDTPGRDYSLTVLSEISDFGFRSVDAWNNWQQNVAWSQVCYDPSDKKPFYQDSYLRQLLRDSRGLNAQYVGDPRRRAANPNASDDVFCDLIDAATDTTAQNSEADLEAVRRWLNDVAPGLGVNPFGRVLLTTCFGVFRTFGDTAF